MNTAFEKGSLDNMAAIVVPLGSTVFSEDFLKESCFGEGDRDFTESGLQTFSYEGSGDSAFKLPTDYRLCRHGHQNFSL